LITGKEKNELNEIFELDRFSGNGPKTQECNMILEQKLGCKKCIMTSSCTDALEMSGLLINIEPGDEIIMPSYTFVSSASAYVLRKAKIVWCDIRMDTKNIDEEKIEELISPKTKAIVIVHYAGVACEMDKIKDLCDKNDLYLIEDAAQAIDCSYKGKPLGSFGDLAAISFHETKNIQCGEGGALIVNNEQLVQRAEFIRDKGTNRTLFNQGIVDKYTWVELGSSFLMSELQAAFLLPQLLESKAINNERLKIWNTYHDQLSDSLAKEDLPVIPDECQHNAHMFYILCKTKDERNDLIDHLQQAGINAIFHYVPLHKAPYWKGEYDNIDLPVTEKISDTILRLPLYYGLKDREVVKICESIKEFYQKTMGN
jgi:dTDP-4-amino-4,6-dideoxygalactose transaminase